MATHREVEQGRTNAELQQRFGTYANVTAGTPRDEREQTSDQATASKEADRG